MSSLPLRTARRALGFKIPTNQFYKNTWYNCSMLLSEGGPPPSQEPPNCCTTGMKYVWYWIVIPNILSSLPLRTARGALGFKIRTNQFYQNTWYNYSMLLSESGLPQSQETPNFCTTGLKYLWYWIVISNILSSLPLWMARRALGFKISTNQFYQNTW